MISPGSSATMPTVSCPMSWTENSAAAVAMVEGPSTRLISSSRPKPGGCAYRRYVLSDWVGTSTTVPNTVRPWTPPGIRSSPEIGGPSFARCTSMAIHDPTRAWPFNRTRASIVRPGGGATACTGRPAAAGAATMPVSSAMAAPARANLETPLNPR